MDDSYIPFRNTDGSVFYASYNSGCRESFHGLMSCKHNVIINGRKKGLMDARQICYYCRNNNLEIPEHFRHVN